MAETEDSAVDSEDKRKPKKAKKAVVKVKSEAEPILTENDAPVDSEAVDTEGRRKKIAANSKAPRAPAAMPTRRSTRNKSQ